MNRGQLAKLLSTLPVLFFVVFLMGGFVFASSILSLNQVQTHTPRYFSPEGSLFNEEIMLQGTTLPLLEGLLLSYFNSSLRPVFMTSVRGIAYNALGPSPEYSLLTRPCVLFVVDEVSGKRRGVRYLFLNDSSGIVREHYDVARSELYAPEPLPVWIRLRDNTGWNFIRLLSSFARVFVHREGQDFEVIAYTGACKRV
ncbi:hypothetical protein FJZ22_03235 [Candidatus Pacearchaeota archaeon]|nr:hypothetical protein [Candidatus Pacearchaeota archaeon]